LEHIKKYPEEIMTDKYGNKYIVYRTYKRSIQCFTQGLFYLNKELYESCGEYGQSKFNRLKLSRKNFKATTLILHHNHDHTFGEGSDYILGRGI